MNEDDLSGSDSIGSEEERIKDRNKEIQRYSDLIKKEQEKREKKKNKVQKIKEYNTHQTKKKIYSKRLSDISDDNSDDI